MDPDREPPQQPSPLSELTDEKLNAEVAELTGASGYARNPRAQRRRPQDDRGIIDRPIGYLPRRSVTHVDDHLRAPQSPANSPVLGCRREQ